MTTSRRLGRIVAAVLASSCCLLAGVPAPAAPRSGTSATPAGAPPAAIRRAAESVLRAVSFGQPDDLPPRRIDTASIPPIDLEGRAPPFDLETRRLVQGAFCRANGLRACPVFEEEVQGTAFVLGRAGRIATCRHLIHDWLYWAWAFNDRQPMPARLVPPIFLVDRGGKRVWTSLSAAYRSVFFVDSPVLSAPLTEVVGSALFWDTDLLLFDLAGTDLPRPLPNGPLPVTGAPVHAIGFAGPAAAVRQYAAFGHVRAVDGLQITTDVTSRRGMSGAPLVDPQGRATAVTCARDRVDGSPGGQATALPLDTDVLSRGLHRRWGLVPPIDAAVP